MFTYLKQLGTTFDCLQLFVLDKNRQKVWKETKKKLEKRNKRMLKI